MKDARYLHEWSLDGVRDPKDYSGREQKTLEDGRMYAAPSSKFASKCF